MTEVNGQRQALQLAIRHFKRQSWEARTWAKHILYAVMRYEKVIGATIPMSKNHLLLVSFDAGTKDFDSIIMEKIVPLIKEYHSSDAATS